VTSEIRAAIARDLRPVRPLLSPSRRALALLPVAAAVVIAVPLMNFFRSDLDAIGFWRAWGLSIAESAVGLAIVALGLCESVPGRSLSRRGLVTAAIVGLALPLAIYGVTTHTFTVGPRSWSVWRFGLGCFRTSVLASAPILAAAGLLSGRAFPVRPAVAGLLYGLGCGLVADAGLRLYCEFTTLPHVILEHFGAVVMTMITGAVIAPISSYADRNRARSAARHFRQD
jgi:hypothetical protein